MHSLLHALLLDTTRRSYLTINFIEQTPCSHGNITPSLIDPTPVLVHVLTNEETVARKQEIDLLQGAFSHFWIEEVDDGHGNEVHRAEEHVGCPTEAV